MLKIIACDDDVAFLDRLHRMIDRWSTEKGTAVDVALVTRGEDLLARHPDYCQGLTIENDLAVMCHALGDLGTAEAMARRSLRSWVGVAHTEALSSLVLGSTLTSSGRYGEALEAFEQVTEPDMAHLEDLHRERATLDPVVYAA